VDLVKYAKLLKIPYFRGVYMRDDLPLKIRKNEAAIINLDTKLGDGTHWTAYVKRGNVVMYFDSIGNLKPPLELLRYLHSDGSKNKISYNYNRFQQLNTFNCGHLCLKFLYENRN